MQIFAGLGNPGAKYAKNRHNIGFMAVESIAEAHGFGPWRAKFQALVAEGRLGGGKVLLMKPDTFMNKSGQAIGEAMRFYKLTAADVTVFHDELDLAPGKCRVKTGGGLAGHNGLRSTDAHIGNDFHRVRLGIGHPGHKDRVSPWVLGDFVRVEQEGWLEDLLRGIADGAPALADGDKGKFMNAVSLRTAPPRSSNNAAEKPAKAAKPAPEPEPEVPQKSPLERLMDKFR
ncbi:peptidyl-tRNA hydrolase [Actibacterium mucosum KCTC 23349]|uniref:Peptidyl-tRNA hydrolase n=1 Tax=Actibacterium mucosum KCTC 23349 TaxID=1454373 RepID=A0A037ZIK8_9RHOB|nr:aminoacyl-tRNA hydrolase [Actibacterium mucosum]KAJ55918.1 peptidyl-tRNA hydrolase [Actibacterium mucosum KCTC 23349]